MKMPTDLARTGKTAPSRGVKSSGSDRTALLLVLLHATVMAVLLLPAAWRPRETSPLPVADLLGLVVGATFPVSLALWRDSNMARPRRALFAVASGGPAITLCLADAAWLTWRHGSVPLAATVATAFLTALLTSAFSDLRRSESDRTIPRLGADGVFPSRLKSRLPLRAAVIVATPYGGKGNGFVVDARGYAVTAGHVVQDHDTVWVRLINGDVAVCRVFAKRRDRDLALVKIDLPYRLPVAALGRNDWTRLGARVQLVGWDPRVNEGSDVLRYGSDLLQLVVAEPNVIPLSLAAVHHPSGVGSPVMYLTGPNLVRRGYSGSAACHPATGAVLGVLCWGSDEVDAHTCVPVQLVRDYLRDCGSRKRCAGGWRGRTGPLFAASSGGDRAPETG
ncbi:MAG TPA: serine protease [Armatimonadota bacterium]|jgi:hypothetical protein